MRLHTVGYKFSFTAKDMRKSIVYTFVACLLIAAMPYSVSADETEDIPANAAATGSHDTLVDALTHAGLVAALQGDGPFTIFAPTDQAFADLGIDLSTYDTPEENETLADILLYHVYSGNVTSSEVTDGLSVEMVNGDTASFTVVDGVVKIGDATVTTADVNASNGIIHVIDKVLTPSDTPNDIPRTAQCTGVHDSLVAGVIQAELLTTLQSDGPFTVFAPSDEAFSKLPKGTVENLLKPENIVRLIPPERLVESAQAYAEVGPLGFNYPPEVIHIWQSHGSRGWTKHKIYKHIMENTLGIKLGDPPPSVDKLEKYTSKSDQIYLDAGGVNASTRIWGYTGNVSGLPNIEIVPDGFGETIFNLSEESGMPFGESAAGYEFFHTNPKLAEQMGIKSKDGEIDWNRFGLAMIHIKNQTGRGFQMGLEGLQTARTEVGSRLTQFAEDTRAVVDEELAKGPEDTLQLGEALSGKATGDWIAEQLINIGVDLSKWGSDQFDDLINSECGIFFIPGPSKASNVDSRYMADFFSHSL